MVLSFVLVRYHRPPMSPVKTKKQRAATWQQTVRKTDTPAGILRENKRLPNRCITNIHG